MNVLVGSVRLSGMNCLCLGTAAERGKICVNRVLCGHWLWRGPGDLQG